MSFPIPTPYGTSEIKSKLLRPALTSHYQVWITPPLNLLETNTSLSVSWLKSREIANAGNSWSSENAELISLSCSDASLPGSTLSTADSNDDYTGINEKLAYRRLYDDRADFTFYVDHDYKIILFFENWIAYVVNEQLTGFSDKNYNYRVNFRDDYASSIYITKFERDFKNKYLQYSFVNAYPTAINSMPVSYESSSLLKCTVSFTYSRYQIKYGDKNMSLFAE